MRDYSRRSQRQRAQRHLGRWKRGESSGNRLEAAENLELPGADLSGEQLAVRVVPVQVDEFTCSRCFLIHHITQLAKGEGAKAVCKECS
jgi:hypothetical protein